MRFDEKVSKDMTVVISDTVGNGFVYQVMKPKVTRSFRRELKRLQRAYKNAIRKQQLGVEVVMEVRYS